MLLDEPFDLQKSWKEFPLFLRGYACWTVSPSSQQEQVRTCTLLIGSVSPGRNRLDRTPWLSSPIVDITRTGTMYVDGPKFFSGAKIDHLMWWTPDGPVAVLCSPMLNARPSINYNFLQSGFLRSGPWQTRLKIWIYCQYEFVVEMTGRCDKVTCIDYLLGLYSAGGSLIDQELYLVPLTIAKDRHHKRCLDPPQHSRYLHLHLLLDANWPNSRRIRLMAFQQVDSHVLGFLLRYWHLIRRSGWRQQPLRMGDYRYWVSVGIFCPQSHAYPFSGQPIPFSRLLVNSPYARYSMLQLAKAEFSRRVSLFRNNIHCYLQRWGSSRKCGILAVRIDHITIVHLLIDISLSGWQSVHFYPGVLTLSETIQWLPTSVVSTPRGKTSGDTKMHQNDGRQCRL